MNKNADLIRELRRENAELRAKLMAIGNVCPFCKEAQAELLCDAVIGMEGYVAAPSLLGKEPTGNRFFKGLEGDLYTCDMMMCENCRRTGFPIFFNGGDSWNICYADGTSESSSSIFVPDFCPIHHNSETLGNAKDVGPILESEAEQWRSHAKMALQMGAWHKIEPFPKVRIFQKETK